MPLSHYLNGTVVATNGSGAIPNAPDLSPEELAAFVLRRLRIEAETASTATARLKALELLAKCFRLSDPEPENPLANLSKEELEDRLKGALDRYRHLIINDDHGTRVYWFVRRHRQDPQMYRQSQAGREALPAGL